MTQDGARRQSAEQAGAIRPELAEKEPRRRAWAKPTLQRFSLQRTLALSGTSTDTHKASSATPT
jgi:hypothetical protein